MSAGSLAERDDLVRSAVAALGPATGAPAGVLLVGRAGVGATSIARAVAGGLVAAGASASDWPRYPPVTDPAPALEVLVVDTMTRLGSTGDAELHDWLTREPRRRAIITARRGHPLPPHTTDLWSAGVLTRVDVPPLGPAGVETMAADLLGGPVTRGLHEYLVRASGGLPLVIRELIADGVADATMVRSGKMWVWRGSHGRVGGRLTDMVRTRLETLTADDREALELVACSGGAPVRILLQLVSVEALDSCERRELIELVDPSTLQAGPPAIELAIRDSLSAARRSWLRQRLSAVLARDADAPDELVQRAATWSLDDGHRPAPDLALAASRAAGRTGEWASAQRLAAAALGTPADREARVALAQALRFRSMPTEALAIIEPALEPPDGDDPAAALTREHAAVVKAHVLLFHHDDPAAALAAIDACQPAGGSRFLDAHRLGLAGLAGCYEATTADMERVVADPSSSDVERAAVWPALILRLAFTGRGRDALAHSVRAITVAPTVADQLPFALSNVTSAAFFARMMGGYDLGDLPAIGLLPITGLIQLGLGLPLIWNGRAAEALVEIDKAIAAFDVDDAHGFKALAYAAAAAAAVLSGDERRGVELADLARVEPLRTCRSIEPAIQGLLLWPEFFRGGVDHVAAVGGALIAEYHERGLHACDLATRHTLLRLGVDRVAPSDELVALVDTPVGHAIAARFRAVAARDAVALLDAADQFEAFDEVVVAAELAAQAHHEARSSGRRSLARTAELRVRALTEGVDTTAYPLLGDWSAPQQLTRREREVVTLAAQQLTNRQIAQRLHTSRRTVEGHLHRAYGKLGVSHRSELRSRYATS